MHIIVTGGASGIGAACVESLVARGDTVTSFDLSIPRYPVATVRYETVDVTNAAAVATAVASASDRSPVLGLVNSAGTRGGAERAGSASREAARSSMEPGAERRATLTRAFADIDTDSFQAMLAVHLLGTFHTMQATLPGMIARRAGAIVNISSMCGIIGCEIAPHYSAAKAAVIGLSKSIVRDVSRVGVRVNVVAPGYVDTPMHHGVETARAEALKDQIPMGRFGHPREIAALVSHLLDSDSAYTTGQVISPSGGQVL